MGLTLGRPVMIHAVRAELTGPGELRLEGTLIDDSAGRELGRCLRDLHVQVVAGRLAALTVNVRKLSFVNSSAIRLFVDMASAAQRAGYRLIFEIDSSITWHRLSFSVLQSLAPESVALKDGGPAGPPTQ